MNLEKIEKIEYKAYEKLINIELFNEIIAFISNTRTGKGTKKINVFGTKELVVKIFKRNISFNTLENY